MDADFLVVGAGSAGCALAYTLVKAGHSVLLLEAGEDDDASSIRDATTVGRAIVEHDWGYHSSPDATRAQRGEPWHRGRVVGGTSSINAMIYVRGNAADYDNWASLGNAGWEAANVMPLFEDIECFDEGRPSSAHAARGRHGPVHVRVIEDGHRLTHAFFESAERAGLPFNADYNGEKQEGAGYTQLTQLGDRRWSAADAFLRPIVQDNNLRLLTRVHVKKITFDNLRATGVVFERDGVEQTVHARRVIISAGVINTPHLLMLSGIGDAETLQRNGIPVVLNRPSVGQGLMEHPSVVMIYQTKVPTHQTPVLSLYEALAFAKTSPEEFQPDVQLEFAPAGVDIRTQRLLPGAVLFTVKKNYPLSRGRIELAGRNFSEPPIIVPQLLAEQGDAETLMRGIRLVRRIVASPPLADFISDEIKPGNVCQTDEELMDYIRNDVSISYHAAGTCRMGTDEEAVVAPELNVRGLENLWIADASIFPHHISGNINAACMMIGIKLGRQLARMF